MGSNTGGALGGLAELGEGTWLLCANRDVTVPQCQGDGSWKNCVNLPGHQDDG